MFFAEEYTSTSNPYRFVAGAVCVKWVEEYIQDNGVFVELIRWRSGYPCSGRDIFYQCLDAARTRTSSPEFPVIYTDTNGKDTNAQQQGCRYSQSPSPRQDMTNVGFCAISRCLTAQTLISRCISRAMGPTSYWDLLTGGGFDPDDLERAIPAGSMRYRAQLSRYSTYTIVGNKELLQPSLANSTERRPRMVR